MVRLLILACLPLILAAQDRLVRDRWVSFRSGPFEVLTNAGDREGRELLAYLEQYRHALGSAFGKEELQSLWPIQIVLFEDEEQGMPYAAPSGLRMGREAYVSGLVAKTPPSRPWLRECALILIRSSTGPLPKAIEEGLADLYSTLEVNSNRITLGTPPPLAERNRDWARAHLLSVDLRYYGRSRVLLRNLSQGLAAEPAYRNAFGQEPAEIERQLDAYMASGTFSTVPVFGLALNPTLDFPRRQVDPVVIGAALADLHVADPERAAQARSFYEQMLKDNPASAEAEEGLGLLSLRTGQTEAARRHFAASLELGSTSARAHVEAARLEPDPAVARTTLEKASGLNRRWAEPYVLMATLESDPAKKVPFLKKAAELARRNAAYWQALADAAMEANDFPEAAKAWTEAEQASAGEEERARLRQARIDIETRRVEYEIAERKRAQDEKEKKLEDLKQEAFAAIRAAEQEANRDAPPTDPDVEVVPWWDDPQPTGQVEGILRSVDCTGKTLHLVIETEDGELVRLLVSDPSEIVIRGGGERELRCGPQKERPEVVVDYFPATDAKQATIGEAASVEFR